MLPWQTVIVTRRARTEYCTQHVQYDMHESKLGCCLCSRLEFSPAASTSGECALLELDGAVYQLLLDVKHVTSHTSSLQKF